jgi:hypothetical protein
MSNPTYSAGDHVYLRESAVLGFVEGYRVTGIQFDAQINQWIYEAAISHRGPSNSTVVDAVNLKNKEILRFRESELVPFCDAVELAYQKAQERVSFLENLRISRCGESSETGD